jgi:excisionase family DNA binding protein
MIERHYSPGELARLLGVSRVTIYNRIQDGDLEAVAFGDRWLVPESAVQRVLDRGRRGSAPTRRGPRPAFA